MPRQGWKKSDEWTERARELIEKYELDNVSKEMEVFISPQAERTYGQAWYPSIVEGREHAEIMLSEAHMENSDEEKVDRTLRHELAHLQAGPGQGHTGDEFHLACAKMNTHPDSVHTNPGVELKQGDIDYESSSNNVYAVRYELDGNPQENKFQERYEAKQFAEKVLVERAKAGKDPREIENLRVEKVMGRFEIEDSEMEKVKAFFDEKED